MTKSFMRLLVLLLKIVFLPFTLLVRFILWASGSTKFIVQREERRRQYQNRPPISAEDYLSQAGFAPEHATFHLAVRKSMAVCCYLPTESIYPDDKLGDLLPFFGEPPNSPWYDTGSSLDDFFVHLCETLQYRYLPIEMDDVYLFVDNHLLEKFKVFSQWLSDQDSRWRQ